jgi:hypothetical protein
MRVGEYSTRLQEISLRFYGYSTIFQPKPEVCHLGYAVVSPRQASTSVHDGRSGREDHAAKAHAHPALHPNPTLSG